MSPVQVPDDSAIAAARERLRAARTVVVKVGSSVLVGEGGDVLDRRAFCALVESLAALRREGRVVVLVTSGAVAVGRRQLGVTRDPARQESLATKQALAAVGQPALMHHYAQEFGFYGYRVAQILLSRRDLAERDRSLNARRTLRALADSPSVIPIVNENDSVATAELKFGDNDRLAALVAHTIDAEALIVLSDVDAVYDRDPRAHADAAPIGACYGDDPALVEVAGDAESAVGTGGMASKLRAARIACDRGIVTLIAPGRDPWALARAVGGDGVGTMLLSRTPRLNAKKAWLAHGALSGGRVHVDAGARRALERDGRSLLPRGIVSVDGRFGEGDVVEVVCDGDAFARGVSAYASADLERIVGLASSEIAAVLGFVSGDAAIHRDDLVLTPDGAASA